MIIRLLEPLAFTDIAPGRHVQVSNIPTTVRVPEGDLHKALQNIPHAMEILYPDDPLTRSLLLPDAVSYYVCYTPDPVYFCKTRAKSKGFRIEAADGVHWAHTLGEVWKIAKAL